MVRNNFLNSLYQICACTKYNSERVPLLVNILKKYIFENTKGAIDIKEEAKIIRSVMQKDLHAGNSILKVMFTDYDIIRSSLFSVDHYNEYIKYMFAPFSKDFINKYGYDIKLLTYFASIIENLMYVKSINVNFNNDIYAFNSKKEYADLSFIKIPSHSYIDKWTKIITFNVDDIFNMFEQIDVNKKTLSKVIDEFSFNEELLNKKIQFRLKDKPLLKISSDKIIVICPYYLINTVIQKLDFMCNELPTYRDNKGLLFEKLSLKILDSIPKSKVRKNIKYNKYELDGILNLKRSSWFIECSSHPPNINSYMGDEIDIINDITTSITKCEKQALRAIDNREHPNIKNKNVKDVTGIIIIVNGLYPNLNMELPFPVIPKTANVRRLIINYFDLRLLMSQPEKIIFEEYLLWRTQNKFPINGIDETDVWTFYLNYKDDRKMMESIDIAKEKGLGIPYIGNRFMDKRYLRKLT